MDSKITRSFKNRRPSNNTKVQEQSIKRQTNKIQNKLQSLKAQIAMRKTMKNKEKQTQQTNLKTTQKNNTGQSWTTQTKPINNKQTAQINNDKINRFLSNRNNQKQNYMGMEVDQDKERLQTLFNKMNMDQYKEVVMDKYGVTGLKRLLQLSEQDIDGWKAVPVGYRVKIRKFINQHHKQNQGQTYNQTQNNNQQKQQKQQKRQQQDIQMIIKRRKNQRIYQPIHDKQIQQDQPQQIQIRISPQINRQQNKRQGQQNSENNEEDEQDILISSLNSAFMQRRGIIKKQHDNSSSFSNSNSRNQNNLKVHWGSQVKQYNKQTSNFKGENYQTKYPTLQKQQDNKYKRIDKLGQGQYCWNCLKKIDMKKQAVLDERSRAFCGASCQNVYRNIISSQGKNKLQDKSQGARSQYKYQDQYSEEEGQEQEQGQNIQDFDLDIV